LRIPPCGTPATPPCGTPRISVALTPTTYRGMQACVTIEQFRHLALQTF
jgi:hypothetical protein